MHLSAPKWLVWLLALILAALAIVSGFRVGFRPVKFLVHGFAQKLRAVVDLVPYLFRRERVRQFHLHRCVERLAAELLAADRDLFRIRGAQFDHDFPFLLVMTVTQQRRRPWKLRV